MTQSSMPDITDAAARLTDVIPPPQKRSSVIPLALMTSYPAMAVLGRLSLGTAALCLGGAAAFFALSRSVWSLAIRSYTSASS